ncbi:MAG TPA: mannosyltransferase family protein [Verrucomicrobiae bacterium]|nr:mannosyltransferase family protein [Verrucomicrobiae bacterium]
MTDNTVIPTTRTPWSFLAIDFILSRLFLVAVAGLSLWLLPKGEFFTQPGTILNWLNHWDTGWYLNIAQHGYQYVPGKQCSAVFFPLYPVLVGWLTCGGAIDARMAGYLLSNGSLFFGIVVLWKLTVIEMKDERCARRVVQLLLLNPVTVFYSSIYTESLYLLCLVGTLYFARTERWLLAAACAYAVALTRMIGLLLVIPLVCEYVLQNRHNLTWRKPDAWRALVCFAAPALGFLTYVAYLDRKFGEPLAFLKAEQAWGRKLVWPWKPFLHLGWYDRPYTIWFVGTAIIAVVLLFLAARWRLRPTYLLILVIFTTICLCSNRLESLPRYFSVLFPFYFVLAQMTKKWPRLTTPLFVVFVVSQAMATILFVNGYWMT